MTITTWTCQGQVTQSRFTTFTFGDNVLSNKPLCSPLVMALTVFTATMRPDMDLKPDFF